MDHVDVSARPDLGESGGTSGSASSNNAAVETCTAVPGRTAGAMLSGEVARRCALAGVRCVVFAGRIGEALPELEVIPLSGDPARAKKDLVDLGRLLHEAKAE